MEVFLIKLNKKIRQLFIEVMRWIIVVYQLQEKVNQLENVYFND